MVVSCLRRVAAAAVALLAVPCYSADAAVPAGLAVFDRVCVACHQPGGVGLIGLAPPLAGTLTTLVTTEDGRRYVADMLVLGLSGRIVSKGQVFNLAMPPQATLSDADLVDVLNHVARDLNGVEASPFGHDDIVHARASKATHKELRELRERLLK